MIATRKPEHWVQNVGSLQKWRNSFRACNLTACPADCVDDDEQFAAFYDGHTHMIRRWAEKHPTHKLIEVDVDDVASGGKLLAAATGFKASCWGPTKCRSSCDFWLDVRVKRLQDAKAAADAALEHAKQEEHDADCDNEVCAKDHRTTVQKVASTAEMAAEALRQADDQVNARDAEKERVKEANKLEEARVVEAKASAERATVDNTRQDPEAPTPSNQHDPNVVCVSFDESITEDWCYAACLNGVCPPDAAKGCMCSTGNGVRSDQQQEDFTACVSIRAGYTDFWCQTSCGAAGTTTCPEDLCSCDEGASQQAQAKQLKAMNEWEETQRTHIAQPAGAAPVADRS